MPHVSKFHVTAHALQRIKERGLSFEEMKNVVNYHDKKIVGRRGDRGGFVNTYQKTAQNKTLTVVAEVKKSEAWIMTGFENEIAE